MYYVAKRSDNHTQHPPNILCYNWLFVVCKSLLHSLHDFIASCLVFITELMPIRLCCS